MPQGNVNTYNIFDMQRVEVLRGPQGTLFGLTSSAGVSNMVTIAPDPSKLEVKAHVDVSGKGKVGSEFGRQTVQAVANLPLTADSALRFSVTGDRIVGLERNESAHNDHVSKDYGYRARYRWRGFADVDVNIIADYDRRTENYNDLRSLPMPSPIQHSPRSWPPEASPPPSAIKPLRQPAERYRHQKWRCFGPSRRPYRRRF